MATNFTPLLQIFKIGQTQAPTSTQAIGKQAAGNNKQNSIFMNSFAEDSIGDSFTRTTKANEENTTNNTTSKPNSTQPTTNTAKTPTLSFGSMAGMANNTKGTSNSFGVLSSNTNGVGNENQANDKFTSSGFGSLSIGGNSAQYTVNYDDEIKELAEELGCEATEEAVKKELQGMSAKELVKLDGKLLDMAEDIGLLTAKDVEEKTGVSEKKLADANKNKDEDRKIKFGTMTSGDMV